MDGLRGLAALAVFGVHFNQIVRWDVQLGPFELDRLLANGEHGVSMFFSLSGFLLSLPFWRALAADGPRPRLGVYAVHRLGRVVPAYYAALTVLIAWSGLWRFPEARADIALHYAFAFNFTEFSIFSINPPFWTLAVEVQFYALLPLLFALLARAPHRCQPWLVLLLGVAAYAMHYALVGNVTRIVSWPLDPRMVWIRPHGAVLTHSLLAHLPHFLLGVLAAHLFLRRGTGASAGTWGATWLNETLFWGALALSLIVASTEVEELVQVPFGRYGLPLVPLLLVTMIFTAPASQLARRWLESVPLRALGTVSYGVYIYHLPALIFLDRYLTKRGIDAPEHGLAFGAAGLAITLTVAGLSYVAIERPVLRWARKLGRPGVNREP